MKHIFQKRFKTEYYKDLITSNSPMGNVNLIGLAVPILFELIFNNLIGTVNTLVLSGYSESAVAATGTVNVLITFFNLFFTVIATGATVLISNAIGANRKNEAQKICWSAIALCGFLGIVLSLTALGASKNIVCLMNLSGDAFEHALVYFRLRITALIIPALTSVLFAIMRSYGYTKSTVLAGFVANIVNVSLNICVINFLQGTYFEGIRGIAVSSIIGQFAGLLVGIIAILKTKIVFLKPSGRKAFSIVGNILKIGVPSGISNGSFTISQFITNSFIALLGLQAISAKMYFTTILGYTYLFSYSLGSANSLLIGRLCGAGEYEKANKLNRFVVKLTIVVNLCISLLIVVFHKPLVSLFTDNPEIILLSVGIFLVDIVTEQARAISHIYEQALRAAGDVLITMIVVLVSCWTFGVGLSYVLSISCNMGLIGCWIGIALDESVRGIFTYYRWRSQKWKKKL